MAVSASHIHEITRPDTIDDLQPEDFADAPKVMQLVKDLQAGDRDERADILLALDEQCYQTEKVVPVYVACLYEKPDKLANMSEWFMIRILASFYFLCPPAV